MRLNGFAFQLAVGCGLLGCTSRLADQAGPALRQASSVTTVDGRSFTVPATNRATVLLFIGADCPIANAYAPEIARLCEEYARRGVEFAVVYADVDVSREAAAKHAAEYRLPCAALFDPKLTLARRVGATVTPEAAVLSPDGVVLYRGRIDDRYPRPGLRRELPTRTDLRDALDEVLAGKRPLKSRTTAVGCYISFPKGRHSP